MQADKSSAEGVRLSTTFWRLLRYVRPYLGILALAIVCSVIYAGARNARNYLVKPLFDNVILPQYKSGNPADVGGWLRNLGGFTKPQGNGEAAENPAGEIPATTDDAESREQLAEGVGENLYRVLLAALLILAVLPLAHFGQEYLAQYTMGRALVDIQQELCAKLLALPLGFHHRTSRGETLSRTTNDATRAHFALDLLFADTIQSFLALLVSVGVLFSISWQLTLTTFAVAPLISGLIAVFGRRIRKSAKRRQESQANVTQRLVQILAGIKVIKAFRTQAVEESAFRKENLRYFRRNMKVVLNRTLARTSVEGLNNGVGLAIILVGAALVMNQMWGLTLGSLAAFVLVMQATYRPMKDLSKGWTHLMEAAPSAERFFELMDAAPDVADVPGAVQLQGVREGIRISDVCFSYGREPVLQNVSLEVSAGEVVAIVGPTGAGKTTLADLLPRFYDPDSGSIEIDGIDLRRIERASLLSHIAVVTQEPFLFAGSIWDNLRYGRPDASEAEIEAAAQAAHVNEFIETLPRGYETDVGDAGVMLSGGQRQRITIGRAILKNPAILIFDEATSALDARSERYVHQAIESLLTGRTVFIIAHRLSTIRHADKIVVLKNGSVVGLGTHQELMAEKGLYQELMSIQSEEREEAPL
jgi:subfamily B ATP-binding cassette protein MsbA